MSYLSMPETISSGSGAPFYYNYVDTTSSHLYPRLASYMKYDAVVAGHSDFESGHRVYDRVAKEMKKEGIPYGRQRPVRQERQAIFPGIFNN